MGILETKQALERARDTQLSERGLPEIAYVKNDYNGSAGDSPVLTIRRGEMGYYPVYTRLTADELNAHAGVTPAQREAMVNGSMFGWHTPGANPNNALVQKIVKGEGT